MKTAVKHNVAKTKRTILETDENNVCSPKVILLRPTLSGVHKRERPTLRFTECLP
jgi:hypothetical protein